MIIVKVRELFKDLGFGKIWSNISDGDRRIYNERYDPEKYQVQHSQYKAAYDEAIDIEPMEPWAPGLIIVISGVTEYDCRLRGDAIIWCPHEELGMYESVECLQWGRVVECEVFQKSIDEYSPEYVAAEILTLMTEDGFSDLCPGRIKNSQEHWKAEQLPIGYVNTYDKQAACRWSTCDEWEQYFEERLPGANYDEEGFDIRDMATLEKEDHLNFMHRDPEKYIARYRLFKMYPPLEEVRCNQDAFRQRVERYESRLEQRARIINEREITWMLRGSEWYSLWKEKGVWRRC